MPTGSKLAGVATIFGLLGLLATLLLWVAFLVSAGSMHASDAAGNALAQSFTFLSGMALWLALGLLLLVAASRGSLSPGAIVGALLLLPASGVATGAVVQLLARDRSQGHWLLVVPGLAPLLVMAYVLWASLPALRALLPARLAGALAAGGLLLLSALPWPTLLRQSRLSSEREAGQQREADARRRQERAEEQRLWQDRFESLPQDAPLWEWRDFTEHGPELRQRALAGMRRLPRRQADAELLLSKGFDFPMRELPELDLAASPVLCGHARRFLGARLEQISPAVPGRPWGWEKDAVDPYLPALAWLLAHGCDRGPELAALEAGVQAYPRDAERDQTAEALARLHPGR